MKQGQEEAFRASRSVLAVNTESNSTTKEQTQFQLNKGKLKVKVKLPLCLTNHHAMKTYGEVEV
jgi:hypothetical protein